MRARRSRPNSSPSSRASIRPSVKKQAIAPAGSAIVVRRIPVGTPQPIGGAALAMTGAWAAPVTIGGSCPAHAYDSVPARPS